MAQEASAKAQAELIKLDAGSQAQAADIKLAAQQAGSKAQADYAASSAQRQADLAAIKEQTEAGLAAIERQRQANGALWSLFKPVMAAAPGGGSVVGLVDILLGAGTIAGAAGTAVSAATAARGRRELAATHTAARRVVDSIDMLAIAAPAVAGAIKAHKPFLDEWQGEIGKNLVDALQKGQTPKLT